MAASVLRRLGFKKHEPRESEARQKLQRELFAYNHCVEHGFPNRPTALAHDPKLKLLAIGTKTGAIRVVGRPGVEYSGQHANEIEVNKLFFLPEQARLVSVCSDNSVHLWEVNTRDGQAVIVDVHSVILDVSKVRNVTACCLSSSADRLFLGTENGSVHSVSLPDLTLSADTLYQDNVMQNVPDDLKANAGPVECIAQHPTKPEKFLIGYSRGLVVLWNHAEATAEQTYSTSQQLESVAWQRDGTQFLTAHADGSYIVWSTSDSSKPKEQATTPYGPFPCKTLSKIQWKTAKSGAFIILAGGMPRASYGDRHTVSVMKGDSQHVTFDFASKVLDFTTICSADELEDYDRFDYDDPHSLVVLTEEEVVAIDLQSDGWPCFQLPYLNSLHSSAITCTAHAHAVPDTLWTKISDAGESQASHYSTRDWPITGGQTLPHSHGAKNLLLTGHEDGSVRYWDVSSTAQRLLYTLRTASIFGLENAPHEAEDDDESWPPFRKVGTFDPYSDDPRLGVQKLTLCPLSETLLVSCTAGQTVVMQWEREARTQEVKVTQVNLVASADGFVWKGHEALAVRGGETEFAAGFQPICVMQLHPPAAATSHALHSEWQMLAVGTAHGFAIFDYNQRVEVASMCTLNLSDLSGAAESGPMSRAKTFKKSLRESFRRLRKRRHSGGDESPQKSKATSPKSSPRKESPKKSSEAAKSEEPQGASSIEVAPGEQAAASADAPAASGDATVETVETGDTSTKAVEREVTARRERSANEEMASMVRALYFADTFLMNSTTHGPTVWAGTNAGHIYAYSVTLPDNDKRDTEPAKCVLGKEIKLQHKAPVLSVTVLDRTATPLPGALEVQHEKAKPANMTGAHQLVVVSEEQIKIFALPSLKASGKYKLTAHEGSKVRRAGFVNFRSKSDERYHENDLAVLTNQGEVQVWTVPQLRRQLKAACVRKENVSGIVSSLFTQTGEGFFLASPSEFVRFSLSARFVPRPACEVLLRDGVRPALPEPAEPEPTAAEASPETAEAAPAAEAATDKAEEVPTTQAATEDAAKTEALSAEDHFRKAMSVQESAETEGAAATESAPAPATESADDSLAVADTTGEITLDSVRIHLNESNVADTSVSRVEVLEACSEQTTVTKTTNVVTTTETNQEGGEVTTSSSTTVTTSATSAQGDQVADDSKMPNSRDEPESMSSAEALEQLYISEDGDAPTPPPPIAASASQPLVDSSDPAASPGIPEVEKQVCAVPVQENTDISDVMASENTGTELTSGDGESNVVSPTEYKNFETYDNVDGEIPVSSGDHMANEIVANQVEQKAVDEFMAPVAVRDLCTPISMATSDATAPVAGDYKVGLIQVSNSHQESEEVECAPFEIETPNESEPCEEQDVEQSEAMDGVAQPLEQLLVSEEQEITSEPLGITAADRQLELPLETNNNSTEPVYLELIDEEPAVENQHENLDNTDQLYEDVVTEESGQHEGIGSIADTLVSEVMEDVMKTCGVSHKQETTPELSNAEDMPIAPACTETTNGLLLDYDSPAINFEQSRLSFEAAPEIVKDEHVTEQAGEHVIEQADEHVSEQADDHVTEKFDEHVTEQVGEHVTEQAGEYVTEQADDHVTEQVGEHVTVQAGEHVTEQTDEHMTEQADEHVTEQASEHVTEQADHVTEQADEHVTEQTDEHVTEQNDDHVTEKAGEHVIEKEENVSTAKPASSSATDACPPTDEPVSVEEVARYAASNDEYEYVEVIEEVEVTDDENETVEICQEWSGPEEADTDKNVTEVSYSQQEEIIDSCSTNITQSAPDAVDTTESLPQDSTEPMLQESEEHQESDSQCLEAGQEEAIAQPEEKEENVSTAKPASSSATDACPPTDEPVSGEEVARYAASNDEYEYVEVIEEVEVTDDENETVEICQEWSGLEEADTDKNVTEVSHSQQEEIIDSCSTNITQSAPDAVDTTESLPQDSTEPMLQESEEHQESDSQCLEAGQEEAIAQPEACPSETVKDVGAECVVEECQGEDVQQKEGEDQGGAVQDTRPEEATEVPNICPNEPVNEDLIDLGNPDSTHTQATPTLAEDMIVEGEEQTAVSNDIHVPTDGSFSQAAPEFQDDGDLQESDQTNEIKQAVAKETEYLQDSNINGCHGGDVIESLTDEHCPIPNGDGRGHKGPVDGQIPSMEIEQC